MLSKSHVVVAWCLYFISILWSDKNSSFFFILSQSRSGCNPKNIPSNISFECTCWSSQPCMCVLEAKIKKKISKRPTTVYHLRERSHFQYKNDKLFKRRKMFCWKDFLLLARCSIKIWEMHFVKSLASI